MYCNNCGAQNEAAAKFCANCGTTLGPESANPVVPQVPPVPPPYQQPPVYQQPAYQPPAPTGGANPLLKNIGIGCLIAIALVFFVGLSCTRACFGLRRASRIIRYR
jgi:hypothetical protein